MPEPPDDVVVPLPVPRESLTPATHVRSTLLLSSLQSLRTRRLYERYRERLDPAMRAVMDEVVAGVWLPMEVGLAHYRAIDALALPLDLQSAMGQDVNTRVQGSVLGLVARAARGAGVTPWTLLGQTPRLWDRMFHGGGGVEVRRLGPKDARVELVGLPIMDVGYLRNAFRGAFLTGLAPFCQRAYASETSEPRPPSTAAYRVSWA